MHDLGSTSTPLTQTENNRDSHSTKKRRTLLKAAEGAIAAIAQTRDEFVSALTASQEQETTRHMHFSGKDCS